MTKKDENTFFARTSTIHEVLHDWRDLRAKKIYTGCSDNVTRCSNYCTVLDAKNVIWKKIGRLNVNVLKLFFYYTGCLVINNISLNGMVCFLFHICIYAVCESYHWSFPSPYRVFRKLLPPFLKSYIEMDIFF